MPVSKQCLQPSNWLQQHVITGDTGMLLQILQSKCSNNLNLSAWYDGSCLLRTETDSLTCKYNKKLKIINVTYELFIFNLLYLYYTYIILILLILYLYILCYTYIYIQLTESTTFLIILSQPESTSSSLSESGVLFLFKIILSCFFLSILQPPDTHIIWQCTVVYWEFSVSQALYSANITFHTCTYTFYL